ncbi:MAG: PLP-dependent aminotransferase family protein [Burkholderiaceae bacterium]
MQANSLPVDFRVSYVGDQPLYLQIYQRFRDAILHGALPPGAKVPSIRALASELNLSRNTIEKAYELLTGEGILVSNGQAGTAVASVDWPSARGETPSVVPRVEDSSDWMRDWSAASPFQLGLPALDAFPLATWITLAHRVARERRTIREQVGSQGYFPLRQTIAAYLQVSRGIVCDPSQVFVTTGYRQSLGLLVSALLGPGDNVWVEDPVYPPALKLLRRTGLIVVPIPVDYAGLDVSVGREIAPHARMALVTPANQNPLGAVMSLRRRSELLRWAATSDAWLFEDDYDSEFCADARRLPTLCGSDRNGRVIYLGSFSKALHPGLRVSYIVVPSQLAPVLQEACNDLVDGGPISIHRTLATFMQEGHFGRHLKRMRSLYTKRRTALVGALEARLGHKLTVLPRATGLCIVAKLAPGISDVEAVERANMRGLAPGALSSRSIARDAGQGLLLGYTNFEDATSIERAVDALAACL